MRSQTQLLSIENISENELLPTVKISKDDLFLEPTVNYFKDKLIQKKDKSVQNKTTEMGCCKSIFFYLCLCCLCKQKDKSDRIVDKK